MRKHTKNLNLVTITTPRKGDKLVIDLRKRTKETIALKDDSISNVRPSDIISNNHSPEVVNEFDWERSEEANVEPVFKYRTNQSILIPPIELSTISLCNSKDMTQAIVMKKQNKDTLVVFTKKKFVNGFGWISGCSTCTEIMLDFQIYANGTQTLSLQEKGHLFKCEHIMQATSFVLDKLNMWTPRMTDQEFEIFLEKNCSIDSNSRIFYSNDHQEYCGGISTKGLYLFIFKAGKWRCSLHEYRPKYKCSCGEMDELPEVEQQRNSITHKTIDSIPESPLIEKEKFSVENLRPIFASRSTALTQTVLKQFNVTDPNDDIEIEPDIKLCPKCKSPKLERKLKNENGTILLKHQINCKIFVFKCGLCQEETSFCGISLGYVNWKNLVIIGIEIIEQYMKTNARTGTPFSSWFKNNIESNEHLKEHFYMNTKNLMSYLGYLHEAFCLASELFTFDDSIFKCCKNPRIISMDGIVLSVKTSKMPKYLRPWIRDEIKNRASKRSERQLESLPDSLLDVYKMFLAEGATNSEIRKLKKSSHIGVRILMHCLVNLDRKWHLLSGAKAFATTLLKDVAPASSLIPNYAVRICEKIANGNSSLTLEELKKFRDYAPILADLYQTVHENCLHNNSAVEELEQLFNTLLILRSRTFEFDFENLVEEVNETERKSMFSQIKGIDSAPSMSQVELQTTGFYFPGYPVIRKIPEVNIHNRKEKNCNKISHKNGMMGAGVVFVCCLVHNCCIGFVILDSAESCKLVTEIILTRFEKAPEILIYDNCCNLAEYQLNRFPKFFENTIHLVDGFHYYSHIGCSETFNSTAYSRLMINVNTSLLEQNNARFSVLKSVAPYLKTRTLGAKLRYSTMLLNLNKQNNNM